MANTIVNIPKVGDACVARLSDGKIMFVAAEDFDWTTLNASNEYEALGAVFNLSGRKAKIVWKGGYCGSNNNWLTNGYATMRARNTLPIDGNEHTLTFSYVLAGAKSGSEKTTSSVTYMGATKQEVSDSLNTAFAADTFLDGLDATAFIYDDDLYVIYKITDDAGRPKFYSIYSMSPLLGSSYFTYVFDPRVGTPKYEGLKKDKKGDDLLIVVSFEKAYAIMRYVAKDTDWYLAYPKENGKIATATPDNWKKYKIITYSQYTSDACAYLRTIYGEGEEGFANIIRSSMYTERQDILTDLCDTKGATDAWTEYKAGTRHNPDGPYSPIATTLRDTVKASTPKAITYDKWFVPGTRDTAELAKELKAGVDKDNNPVDYTGDAINRTLHSMGLASPISNNISIFLVANNGYNTMFYSGQLGRLHNAACWCQQTYTVPVTYLDIFEI